MDSIYNMVDIVLLTVLDGKLKLALLKRDKAPAAGVLTIIGGKIEPSIDEDAFGAALRILCEKAMIKAPYLEELRSFTGKFRDSRKWSVSIAHYALVPHTVIAESSHPGLHLVDVDNLPPLPFDHARMVETALERIRSKGRYSSLPCYLAGDSFTLTELQTIYEIVLGERQHKSKFRPKIEQLGVLEKIHGATKSTGGAPADLYRVKSECGYELRMLQRGL